MKATRLNLKIPAELSESLDRFRRDYPVSRTVAFIMMRFGKTRAHNEIMAGIREELGRHSIEALRADHKEYHDDLFWNILTYVHSCSFGIAVFERIEMEEFNPNVALEVGYLMALRKPVLLLKDRTLKNLTTDLIGKLYRTFDPQTISESLGPEINRWLKDKGIIRNEREVQREALAFTEFVTNPYWNSLSRVSGKSLDELFTALRESTSRSEFASRCFPEPVRRKVFLDAITRTAEGEKFLKQANALRDRFGMTVYA